MVMAMKGHNGFSPCRMCKITGLRPPDTRGTTHYIPLHRARHPDIAANPTAVKCYDSANLPMRTHQEFLQQGQKVQQARNDAEFERLSRECGIKGVPVISTLASISLPWSFPYDFMHLIFENMIPNLVLLWTGDFKGLDCGREQYQLQPSVWDAIGAATAASGPSLPYAFCSRPVNVANHEKHRMTADSWSFWFQYIAPVVLESRFSHPKFYKHFVDFVKLVRLCLKFDLTQQDISDIRLGFQSWVSKYEEVVTLYYETYIDLYARRKAKRPALVAKTFFGQLQHIFVVRLPLDERLGIPDGKVHIIVAIEPCKITRTNPSLDIHWYKTFERVIYLDVICIQCLVGRVRAPDGGWGIVDRSGDLARAIYAIED
ncbi:hypothetical protein CONPUDRAFT_116660 [Coniophora puteana RWD-64-598 SS2]|uniref:Uncharacterized protein n=1 Tax=Coniophora puteana (strain RWD-64-598) TaxID=741705 RepID=A0A5M3N7Y7_CONPW|nr:uncharacterized protein CONPUDRAFT_116660 [Coniophora puteana RWD-64-598 SS2]EIW87426.1 hypothetical protein CONPUDRAFT_116660 [Coniophora puteana RWD-64-598 SS2]